jgi:hypothetical protein
MQTVVHIGCMKTGTTTLQKYLFNKLDSVRYIGRYNQCGYPTKKTFNAIRKKGSLDEEKQRWNQVSREAEDADETLLYSVEGLTHSHISEQDLIARRTREIVGDGVILLTIRNQVDIAKSQYFNFVGKGYDKSFDEFINDGLSLLDFTPEDDSEISILNVYRRQPGLIWSIWQYAQLVDIWGSHFEEVHVLPLEAWHNNPEGTIDMLAETLDIDKAEIEIPEKKARSRTSNLQFGGLKLGHIPFVSKVLDSKLFPRQLDRFVRDNYLTVELTEEHRTTFQEIYGPENRRLMDHCRFDLEKLNYPLV